jgi:hypothetical protein
MEPSVLSLIMLAKKNLVLRAKLKDSIKKSFPLQRIIESNIGISEGARLYLNKINTMRLDEEVLEGSSHGLEVLFGHTRGEIGD